MGDDRPPVYWEDDTLIIRASAIGGDCLWELIACGQGYTPNSYPANILRAFAEGNTLEPVVIRMLEDEGWEFRDKQVEGELILPGHTKVRYHPDGIARSPYNHRLCVVEVKALHNDVWQKAARYGVASTFTEYAWQLSAMMIGEGMPGVWVAYNKGLTPDENGNREPCEDEGKLLTQLNVKPPITLDEIKAKAELIRAGVTGEDIIEAGRPCDNPNHWPCLFLHLRPEADTKAGVVVGINKGESNDTNQEEVDELVRSYLYHKGQADEARKRYEAARDEIIRLGRGQKKLVTDKWVVPIIESTGAASWDWGAMPEDLKGQLEEYRKPGKKYKYISGIKRRD